jgi:hypothetical protein
MRRPTVALALALAVGCLLLTACGSDNNGFPPSIANLSYSPTSGTVGQTITITGTFSFTDREGDVDTFGGAVSGPGGTATLSPQSAGVSGLTEGTVQFALVIVAQAAGTYQFQLWLVDKPGNRSNILAGSINVQ